MTTTNEQWDGRVAPARYAVACLDILGQQAEFTKLPGFLKDAGTVEEAQRILRGAYGTLHRFRSDFEALIRMTNEHLSRAARAGNLTGASGANEITTYSFADTLVAYMRFSHEPADCYGVTALVVTSAVFLLSRLARRIPVRGSMEVDWASPVGDKEIYGPVLIEAHRLESGVARYPRVVVGKGLLDYLAQASQLGTTIDGGATTSASASDCIKLLFRDNDGQMAIDCLGAVVDYMSGGETDCADLARQAATFLRTQQPHFASLKDNKLAPRYTVARRYCESRSFFLRGDKDEQAVDKCYRESRIREQKIAYDATGDFLHSRGMHPRSMAYDWLTGGVAITVAESVDPSMVEALRTHLQNRGVIVSSVTIEMEARDGH